MADERCDHGLIVGQCGHCKPVPPGLTASVWTTRGGSVFHRSVACDALADGQARAARTGRDVHQPTRVALADAMAQGRGACIPCFPGYRPTSTTKPCLVRVGTQWLGGLLTEWRRGADGRWSGVVSYVADGEQVTVVKDQEDLRPAS
ncbi:MULTISPECIES: hypothetical protein [Kitasatospora]|uniref:Uncharacterized protein n=1 Tax=Kitasatospora cathayae TaxID=3004092 RepID=A0ABY7QCW9_9ACTN|nr:hypothetical protein [Kitasatospora sp. HUAS 3-15]WBP90603.1 hypothetical protein O1G21_35220 [Kitasatospora sp. HUAS 3-15]